MTAPSVTRDEGAAARDRGLARRSWAALRAGLRRHWLIVVLVALAAVVRVLVMVAYVPAFWFDGDSGTYIDLSETFYPFRDRPLGYPLLLTVLRVTGSLVTVVLLQHLAGLLLGAGIYALLRRRGLGAGVAALAATPILFDALQIDLEHYILTETMFTTLLLAAVGLLLWWEKPAALACALAGLLMAGAWFTRPVALGVAVLLGGYLLLRRVGWRRLVAFGAAFVIPWSAVMLWVDGRPTVYGSGSTGMFLYGRTAQFADCERLSLPPERQWLCPPHPRHDRADWYLWAYLPAEYREDPANDAELRRFALDVITRQPGDYLATVARETAPYFLPWPDLGPEIAALNDQWVLPRTARDGLPAPALASDGFRREPADRSLAPEATALTEVLHWYGRHVRTPALFTTIVVVAAIVAAVRSRRRPRWPDARDAVLLVVITGAFLVAQVATSMYEPRYGLPALGLISVAGALSWRALRGPGRAGPRPGSAPRSGEGGGARPILQQADEVVAVPTAGQ